MEGPYGLFSTEARTRDKVVMIGAGIGITPLRALLETTPFAPGDATVILRGHTDQELYLGNEIIDICRQRGVRLFHATGSRANWDSGSWLPADAVRSSYTLASYAPEVTDSDVYICGPLEWANNVIADARTAGVRPEQIHHERFDW
jgi:ferredoxin-NADP reductase